MIAKATQRNIRVSSKKAKLVCDLVRNMKAVEAYKVLENCPHKTAKFLYKLLTSAVANAVNNFGMNGDDLYIYHVVANQGPTYKRLLPRAKGRQDIMRKRTTHLVVEVSDNLSERATLNVSLLKPRAHRFSKLKERNEKKAIAVETKVVDNKGVVKQ